VSRLRRLGLAVTAVLALLVGVLATPAGAADWYGITSKWSGKCVDLRPPSVHSIARTIAAHAASAISPAHQAGDLTAVSPSGRKPG
jgi:hypothetical protein